MRNRRHRTPRIAIMDISRLKFFSIGKFSGDAYFILTHVLSTKG